MRRIIYLLTIILLFTGCSSRKKESDLKIITVTIEPLRFFTNAIAGNKFNVVSIVPQGSSPETYDPKPQQLVDLSNSEVYFKIGHIGFEQIWMDKIKSNNPNLKIYDTSKGIKYIKEKAVEHNGHHHEGGLDPHVWNSNINAKIICENIYKALCSIDPANKEYFKERYDGVKAMINDTDKEIKKLLSNADSTFMIYHPALTYYAKEYGLKQICIEEGGKEPSPNQLKTLIDKANSEKPKVIFIQEEFDVRNAQLLAQELNLNLVVINPLSFDWHVQMIKPAKALAKNE